jgi:hypothetical protein
VNTCRQQGNWRLEPSIQGFGSALILCGSVTNTDPAFFLMADLDYGSGFPDPDAGSGFQDPELDSRIRISNPDSGLDDLKLEKNL